MSAAIATVNRALNIRTDPTLLDPNTTAKPDPPARG